ncbi:MAG: DUF4062 domain-containing protein [Anaerolineales bacterium]|nr:DUF4062 domain-containing protein [Anaerolineales bacterium]
MTLQWQTVRIFISSTFEDMHAERDLLIKQVFPELRGWCEQRKLHLVDIDLRWGVREEDTQNRNVVDVCLKRIDEARPFFLCFLGQRRGWVPGPEDVSDGTLGLEAFPDLREAIGSASVTELEILHALVNPFHRSRVQKSGDRESYDPVKYAFFYLRDPDYLAQLPEDFPALRAVYTNEGIQDLPARAHADEELQRWVSAEIPALCTGRRRPLHNYTARWNQTASTPELLLPLEAPSASPDSISQWQGKWEQFGVRLEGTAVIDPAEVKKALEVNQRRSAGRLTDFFIGDQPLSQVILNDLKAAILDRFPEHNLVEERTDLQQELDQQSQFQQISSEGFIQREGDFETLDKYAAGDDPRLFVLTARAGSGKSTLLANWIKHYQPELDAGKRETLHFRFIGQSDLSASPHALLYYLLRELKDVAGKIKKEIPADPQKLRKELPDMLDLAGKQGKTIIVVDALNQLENGLDDLAWLPRILPPNIRLIVSFKRGEEDAEALLDSLQDKAVLAEVQPFENMEDRRSLVNAYLAHYLKELDERHLEVLIGTEGAENPLFLKVILSELRVFGAFTNLGEKIRSGFGSTPLSAFAGVLQRLESDPAYSPIDPAGAVPLIFGLLAYARQGLSVEELTGMLELALAEGGYVISRKEAQESVLLYLRQMQPFLAFRDRRFDFFYESFKLAARARYTGGTAPEMVHSRSAQDWHSLLGCYFYLQPLTQGSPERDVPYAHKLSEQPFQLAAAHDWERIYNTLTDFTFLEAKCLAFPVYMLEADFRLALMNWEGEQAPKQVLEVFADRLRLDSHYLQQSPELLFPLLYNHLTWLDAPLGPVHALCESQRPGRSGWLRSVQPTIPQQKTTGVSPKPHMDEVHAAAFSPDGKTILSGSKDSMVKLWDTASGHLIRTYEGHIKGVNAVVFSPDGRRLISSSEDKTIRYWDLESGRLLRSFRIENSIGVKSVAFFPDGRRMIAGSLLLPISLSQDGEKLAFKGSVSIWDLETGQQLQTLTGDSRSAGMGAVYDIHIRDVRSGTKLHKVEAEFAAAFSPDGSLFLGDKDNVLLLWDTQTGEKIREFEGHTSRVTTLAFLPDGRRFISASWDSTVRVWDTHTGEQIESFELSTGPGSKPWVMHAAVSPDGERVICGLNDSTMRLIDLQRREQPRTIGYRKQSNIVTVPSPDGSTALTGSYASPALLLWDTSSGRIRHILQGHTAPVNHLLYLPNGLGAISQSLDDGSIRLWDLVQGRQLYALQGTPLNDQIQHGPVSPDSRFALLYQQNRPMQLWDLHTGLLRPLPGGINIDGLSRVVFSPDGRKMVIVRDTYVVVDLETGEIERSFGEYRKNLQELCFTRDGSLLAARLPDNTILIWDFVSGALRHSLNTQDFAARMILAADGKTLISHQRDHSILFWNLEDGKDQFSFSEPQQITILALSQDGSTLISGYTESNETRITFRRVPSGEVVSSHRLPGYVDGARAGLSAEGRQFIFFQKQNDDHQINVLETQSGQKIISASLKNPDQQDDIPYSLEGYPKPVRENTFSTDGGRVISRYSDHVFKAWDAETGAGLQVLDSLTSSILVEMSEDGAYAVRWMRGNPPEVWDVAAGRQVLVLQESPENINQLSFSPDGLLVIANGGPAGAQQNGESNLVIWELQTGKRLHNFLLPAGRKTHMAVSADFAFAAASMEDNSVLCWDLEKRRLLFTREHNQRIESVEFFPSSDQLYTNTGTNLYVWDLPSGPLLRTLGPIFSSRGGLKVFDGDTAIEIKGGNDRILIWDLRRGQLLKEIEISGQMRLRGGSGDGILVLGEAFNSGNNRLDIWDSRKARLLFSVTPQHRVDTNVLFFPDGKTVLSGSNVHKEEAVQIWDLKSGKLLRSMKGHTSGITGLALSADGKRIASTSYDKSVKVWETRKGELLHSFEQHMDSVGALAFSPDGRMLASGDNKGDVYLWDLDKGELVAALAGCKPRVVSLAFSRDGKTLLSADWESVKIRDLPSGSIRFSLSNHGRNIEHAALLLDGNTTVSISGDISGQSTTTLWDIGSGELIQTYQSLTNGKVCLLPCGKFAVTEHLGKINLITGQVETNDKILFVEKLVSGRDGALILGVQGKNRLVRWDSDSKAITTLFAFDAEIAHIRLSPDESRLAVGDTSGKVWIFEHIR